MYTVKATHKRKQALEQLGNPSNADVFDLGLVALSLIKSERVQNEPIQLAEALAARYALFKLT